MKILLFQLDGKLPNLALMRIAAHHASQGDDVELRGPQVLERQLWDAGDELVYASAIFEKTRPLCERLRQYWPEARLGGTGWDVSVTLGDVGIWTKEVDYSIHPGYRESIGFSQRGCRLSCPFCVVPRKEGKISSENRIEEIWRGDPWPKDIVLLDNDFFGQPTWPERIEEIRAGPYRVNFNQGINARFLTPETAAAIATVDYRTATMKTRRLHTAWDNRKDEKRLFKGLQYLVDAGVKRRDIMVYILLGYWPWSDLKDWDYRRSQLREFGCDPYPMPFKRTLETVGFQRWVVGHYDKRVPWSDWVKAKYRPENLRNDTTPAEVRKMDP